MKQHPICSLADAIQQKLPVALTTVVEVNGASPAKVGAQITLCEDGSTAGTVGGGELEADIATPAATSSSPIEAPAYIGAFC
ncbi:MAG: XdhC family protein [Chloroflexota bacterium]